MFCWILNVFYCRTVVPWTKEWNPSGCVELDPLVGNQITRLAAPCSAYWPPPPCLTVGPTNRPSHCTVHMPASPSMCWDISEILLRSHK